MKEQLKVTRIIHLALCLGVLIVYIYLLSSDFTRLLEIPDFDSSSLLYIGILILAVLLSHFLYKNQINKADKSLPMEKKALAYQAALVTRWAPLEAAAFIFAFFTFSNENNDYILYGVIALLYMVYLAPTESEFKKDFEVYN